MADQEKDLTTLLEDVKTIKSILQQEDAPFPAIWKVAFVVAPSIATVGLLQYFVPALRGLSFDQLVFFLWIPGFLVVFPTALALVYREIRRTGRGFLGQGRIRHVLFARFVIPPAALVLLWVSSRNPVFGLEGISLVVIAMWQTAVEQVLPPSFRPVPLAFLGLGLAELALDWRGPEVVLLNVLLVAGAIVFAATLLLNQERRRAGGR